MNWVSAAIPEATGRPDKETKKDRKGKEQGKTKNKWAYRKLPTYMTRRKIILKMPKAEIPNRIFSLRTNPLVLFWTTFKG
jgi:intergrase/recombinase